MIYSAIIITLSFFTQAVLGFGGGLIAIPILSLYMPVADAVTLAMFFQFFMVFIFFSIYRDIDLKKLKELLPGLVIGSVAGIFLLKYLAEDHLRIFLILFIALYLVHDYGAKNPWLKKLFRINGYVAGFFGGVVMGVIGMGGPVFTIYLKEKAENFQQFRATMVAVLFTVNLVRFPISFLQGLWTHQILLIVAITFPFFVAALWFGQRIHKTIPEKLAKNLINLLLGICIISLATKIHLFP